MKGQVENGLAPAEGISKNSLMNPDVKAEWVEALRSGKYEQGTGRLRDDENRYCCLGVLCDLAVKRGIVTAALRVRTADLYPSTEWHYGGDYMYPPPAVLDWAGLADKDPRVNVTVPDEDFENETVEQFPNLSELNDDYHDYGFNEIATVIEEQL